MSFLPEELISLVVFTLSVAPKLPPCKGRWDGKISTASRVASNIPHANSTVDQLIKLFTSKGLTTQDLVAYQGLTQ
ncbi:hypothetical protein JHK87_019194 [Glycine soja]|nr:hypothetical protein JHK87_019194 [Glycine soja]